MGRLKKLTNQTKSRISLVILFLAFEAGIFAIAKMGPGLRLDVFTWLLVVFAASFGGSAIAYMFIGEWIRWPLTKEVPHSSNSNMVEIEPKYEGWLKSPGMLLCCPICASTWVGAMLLGLMVINFNLGYYTIVALSLGAAARVVTRFSELLEWQARYAQERTAGLNRVNAQEEAGKNGHSAYEVNNGKSYWVVQDKEVEESNR
jgi:hypothetical protein